MKRLVIIAGEESGDQHAAAFVRELQQSSSAIHISGIGGVHMEAAGVELISDLARFGVTGISEVLKHARVIHQAFQRIKEHLRNNPPDLLVLVDFPGFNLRLAKFAKQTLGIKVLYYIGPQIWAWKANRINLIRKYVDHMAVILPFEKDLYTSAGISASFVGHPLLHKLQPNYDPSGLREKFSLPLDCLLLALLPGSRTNEIERHMQVLCDSAERVALTCQNLHVVIPVARTIDRKSIQKYLDNSKFSYTLVTDHAIEVMACSDAVVVASGTASLECALLKKPMCIIYKVSLLSYLVASKFIKIQYIGLCNLLQKSMIVPELLQYDCNPDELSHVIKSLLLDQVYVSSMIQRLDKLNLSLAQQSADISLVDLIKQEMCV